MVPGEFSQECCPLSPFTERNTPRELNLTLGIAGIANMRRHGSEKKDYELNKLNKNKIKAKFLLYFFVMEVSFMHLKKIYCSG